jgi:hypothetical protein
MKHELKCNPIYFQATWEGRKPFEIRKNDRGFQVGETVVLKEYDFAGDYFDCYTGREITAEIIYLFNDFGLEPSYCVFGIKEISRKEVKP